MGCKIPLISKQFFKQRHRLHGLSINIEDMDNFLLCNTCFISSVTYDCHKICIICCRNLIVKKNLDILLMVSVQLLSLSYGKALNLTKFNFFKSAQIFNVCKWTYLHSNGMGHTIKFLQHFSFSF